MSSDAIKPSVTVYVASFGALLGAVSMGLALGYTTPAFDDMDKQNSTLLSPDKATSESQKGLIGSMLAVGALVGGFLGEPCNKLLGRRISLIAFGVPFIIGWLCLFLANSITWLVLGRLLTGLCCGLVSGTAPTYVVEIAPPSIRGLLGTCFQVMVVIGILLACVFGLFSTWWQLAGWSLLPSLVTMLIMFFMPETPQWLLSKGRTEEAEASLIKLRTTPVTQELSVMAQAATNAQQGASQYSFETIKSREFYKPFILALGLMFFQQFSGINAVLFYQTDIFKKASPKADALMSAIYVCIAQVIATLAGSALVDRLGRKILLFASGFGHTLSLIVFGWYSYHSTDVAFQRDYAWISLASLIVFVVAFSLGFGPVPWMMIPELSSTRVRSMVASLATAFNWTCVYIVTAAVKSMISSLGDAATYWIFASICAVSCIFVYFALPETKGRSAEQIQVELLGEPAAQDVRSQKLLEQPMKVLA
uniref:Facilitated trehalose transporter Tret1 n=1 Tax=Aceria tosichella TaxID=561515 RepID=A0A6G1SA25_9ACAR